MARGENGRKPSRRGGPVKAQKTQAQTRSKGRNSGTKASTSRLAKATKGKPASKQRGRGRSPAKAPPPPIKREVQIRQLDPQTYCGARTSVKELYRVREVVDGRPVTHLVYWDRHGWYCDHGQQCVAVRDVLRQRPDKVTS